MTRNTKTAVAVLIGLAVAWTIALNWAILSKFRAYDQRIDRLAVAMEQLMDPNYRTTITTGDPPIDIEITATAGTEPEGWEGTTAAWFKKLIDDARAEFPNPVQTGGGT